MKIETFINFDFVNVKKNYKKSLKQFQTENIDDVVEKTHEELYKEFKKAVKKKKINHFEITTNDKNRW